jgi:HD-GYP domain-containing protein (c-di-GMP phosphodiesterase class II)
MIAAGPYSPPEADAIEPRMNRRQGQVPRSGRATARPPTDPHTLNTALRAWASAIDSVGDLVFMHDENGCLMRANQAYAARTGAPAADLLGRPFRALLREAGPAQGLPSDDTPAPCTATEQEIVLATGETYRCRTLPVQDDTGAVVCCVHIMRERAAPTDAGMQAGAPADIEAGERRLRRNLEATIEAFAAAIELSDPHNAGHGRRVAALGVAIGEDLRLSRHELEGIRLAALIHDVGSFKIPVEVLVKPGKLTAVERLLVQSHPEVGHRILHGIEFPWPIADIVLQHHERIDGSGYPRGLPGTGILLEAKVIAVADAMEAMLSDRPYRPGLPIESALRELVDQRGTFYDPAIVDACVRVFGEQGFVLPE